jgi:hypothetical protein
MSGTVWTDYIFKAPTQADLVAALAAIQAAGLVAAGDAPTNMLGDAVTDGNGNVLYRCRQGRAAQSFTDPDTQQTVTVPQTGDGASFYVWIRTTVPPSDVTVDPSTFGLTVPTQAEAASVLGVWA